MPHIQIDYSGNLEPKLDIAALCRALRDAGRLKAPEDPPAD